MRYFWDLVSGDVVATKDKHLITALLAAGYIEVSREQYVEIAKAG